MEHTESMHTAEEHVHVHADGTVHSHSHAHTHQNTKTVKNRLARVIGHMHAVDAVQKGDTETLSELDKAIDLLMK